MIPMTIRELASIMKGTAVGDGDISAEAKFQFDSRAVKPGDISLLFAENAPMDITLLKMRYPTEQLYRLFPNQ